MMRAGGLTMFRAASDSVMLCASVNEVTTMSSWRTVSAEQEQADQEQQMVRADQDVVNAGRNESADHRRHALTGAREVFEAADARDRESPASAPRLRTR